MTDQPGDRRAFPDFFNQGLDREDYKIWSSATSAQISGKQVKNHW